MYQTFVAAGLAVLLLGTGPTAIRASQVSVDVELVIAVDVSGSMRTEEHELQRRGFLAAFSDETLIRAIQSGPYGRIAVTYMEWADQYSQSVLVPWRIIKDHATARVFREELAPKPRSAISGTSISSALLFATSLFAKSPYQGSRKVIDVSGDGPNRTGKHVNAVRDAVLRQGIIINGLPIMLSPMLRHKTHGVDLHHYFEDCVIGGPGAFVYPVRVKEQFAEAIRRKLIIEVSGQPAQVVLAAQRSRRLVNCQIGRSNIDSW